MVRPHITVLAVALMVVMSVPLLAQRPVSPETDAERRRRSDVIENMETALARGVRNGADAVSTRLRRVVGDSGTFEGGPLLSAPSAFGGYAPSYGMVFTVRVPGMDGTLVLVAQSIAIKARGSNTGLRPTPPPVAPVDAEVLTDPNSAYRAAVTEALIDAMLTYGGSLGLGENESLTVFARRDSPANALDPSDRVKTVTLTVKGSVISALGGKKIDLADAKKQVAVEQD